MIILLFPLSYLVIIDSEQYRLYKVSVSAISLYILEESIIEDPFPVGAEIRREAGDSFFPPFFCFYRLLLTYGSMFSPNMTLMSVCVSYHRHPYFYPVSSCGCFILSNFTIFKSIVASSVLSNHIGLFT